MPYRARKLSSSSSSSLYSVLRTAASYLPLRWVHSYHFGCGIIQIDSRCLRVHRSVSNRRPELGASGVLCERAENEGAYWTNQRFDARKGASRAPSISQRACLEVSWYDRRQISFCPSLIEDASLNMLSKRKCAPTRPSPLLSFSTSTRSFFASVGAAAVYPSSLHWT